MKMSGTTKNKEIVARLTSRAEAFCASAEGFTPYSTEVLTTRWSEAQWEVSGTTSAGNFFAVKGDGEGVSVSADTRRHALHAPACLAGEIFQAFFSLPGEGLDLDALESVRLSEYDSQAPGLPWWETTTAR